MEFPFPYLQPLALKVVANNFYKDLNKITGKFSWNFTKILISKNGSETHVFSSNVEPNDQSILSKIEKLL